MTIIFVTAFIIAYMINSIVGMALMIAYAIQKLFFSKEKNKFIRTLELMIISLPMSYIGIAGTTMHQLFSWYNVFLIVFLLCILKEYSFKIPFPKTAIISLIIMLLCYCVNFFWTDDIGSELTEITQIFVMMIPIIIIHTTRSSFPLTKDNIYNLICKYADVCVATALSMLFQYIVYFFFHIRIGLINITGGNRVQFYGLFRGASILPIFMGTGIVFFFLECFEKEINASRLAKIGIIFLSMVLNTSRTAIFALMVVLAFVCIKYIHRSPSAKGIIITALGFTGSYFAIEYITTLRRGLAGFLDANGRQATWEDGIRIWNANLKNIVIGEGFSGGRWDGITKPHNMVIQSLAQCGVIITLILIGMMISYLYSNRHGTYVLIPVFIIISGMLVTDFYANAFTTVIFILIDLYSGAEELNINYEDPKETSYV